MAETVDGNHMPKARSAGRDFARLATCVREIILESVRFRRQATTLGKTVVGFPESLLLELNDASYSYAYLG